MKATGIAAAPLLVSTIPEPMTPTQPWRIAHAFAHTTQVDSTREVSMLMPSDLPIPSTLQRAVFPFLSAAIQRAHSLAPAKWAISLHPWGLRLNFAFTEAFTLSATECRVLIVGVPRDARALQIAVEPSPYESAANAHIALVRISSVSSLRRALTASNASRKECYSGSPTASMPAATNAVDRCGACMGASATTLSAARAGRTTRGGA
jgi:hypothetical protein